MCNPEVASAVYLNSYMLYIYTDLYVESACVLPTFYLTLLFSVSDWHTEWVSIPNLTVDLMVPQTESEKQSWKPVLMVVTEKDLLLYDSLPRSKEAWHSPAHIYPLLATR